MIKSYVLRLQSNHSNLFIWREIQETFTLHSSMLTETYILEPIP